MSGAGTAAPAFGAGSGGGGGSWTLLGTQSVSAASAVTYTNLTSTYNIFMLVYGNIVKSTTATSVFVVFGTDNGTTWVTTSYASGAWVMPFTTTVLLNNNASAKLYLAPGNAGNLSGCAYFTGFGWSTYPQMISESVYALTTTTGPLWVAAAGSLPVAATYNAFKVYPSAGTITGTFSLYGLAK